MEGDCRSIEGTGLKTGGLKGSGGMKGNIDELWKRIWIVFGDAQNNMDVWIGGVR